jgi:hypothetical protein
MNQYDNEDFDLGIKQYLIEQVRCRCMVCLPLVASGGTYQQHSLLSNYISSQLYLVEQVCTRQANTKQASNQRIVLGNGVRQ